jgi:membrane protease YdiL (CAAX protease family)
MRAFSMNSSAPNRQVILYIAAVLVAAWLWMLSLRLGFRPPEWVWITVLMWIPGLASILFRLLFREGFADVGWRIGKARFWAWAYIGPLGLASLSVLLALLLGRVTVAPHLSDQTMLEAVFFKLSWPVRDAPVGGLLIQRFLAVALISIGPGFFCAFGEELGWRGYLLPRLMQAGWPSPLLLSGVVWGIWHLPLFVFTGYAHGKLVLSLLMFTLLTALFGVFIGWLRLASGSVFVAAMAHTSFNAFVQSFFGVSFVGDGAWFLIGDYGVLTLISYGALVAWLYWSRRVDSVLARNIAMR